MQVSIAQSGAGVVVSWPSFPGGWQLQQCGDLGVGGWSSCTSAVSDDGTNCHALVSPASGKLFFRLSR